MSDNTLAGSFPAQSDEWVSCRVAVCFDFDTSTTVGGTIVRCDVEEPGLMIIRLDDGRHVMSTECQYTFSDRYLGATPGPQRLPEGAP